jgi:hypothetical protein
MKTGFLMTGLVLLLVTCLLMSVMVTPSYGPEGFTSYYLSEAADTGMAPIGAYDGIKLQAAGGQEYWRSTSPNVPLNGPAFEVGPDNLFMFKNNAAKPECCGSTYSTDTGCVCTTPEQRKFLNMRGGNRTVPDDGF